MKIKAVIARPDRTNDVVVMKPKDVNNGIFRHRKHLYMVDPECVQITMEQKFPFGPKSHFSTYYYKEGVANPLPFPHFGGGKPTEAPEEFEGEVLRVAKYPKVVDQGVSSEELAAIFNPWLYQIIGKVEDPWYLQMQFWLLIGVVLACVYIAFQVTQIGSGVDELAEMVRTLRRSFREVDF